MIGRIILAILAAMFFIAAGFGVAHVVEGAIGGGGGVHQIHHGGHTDNDASDYNGE